MEIGSSLDGMRESIQALPAETERTEEESLTAETVVLLTEDDQFINLNSYTLLSKSIIKIHHSSVFLLASFLEAAVTSLKH